MKRNMLKLGMLLALAGGTLVGLASCEKEKPQEEDTTENIGGVAEELEKPQTNGVQFDWVLIPEGQFVMGSPTSDPAMEEDEAPLHKVHISRFWMSKTEVTFDQYGAFCKATGRDLPHDAFRDKDHWGRGQRPVIWVTKADAMAFCKWAGVSLPTEAQWEYACRAGTETRYSVGNKITHAQANFKGSEWEENGKTVGNRTREAGQYPANAFGLHDMHGNVWEWVSDWYVHDFYKNWTPGAESRVYEDPVGPVSGSYYGFRGGSWYDRSANLRSANRHFLLPFDKQPNIGFRVVAPVQAKS